MRYPFVILVYALGSALLTTTLAAQPSGSIAADLSFHFVCREKRRGEIERRIEAYLETKKFRVLNQADIQRRHDVHLFDTNLVALDQDQRMIEIRSVPRADARYSFYLYSRPPTNHLISLEADILRFISENLNCETRQIARNANGPEVRKLYNSEIRRVKSLFDQADRINGRPRINRRKIQNSDGVEPDEVGDSFRRYNGRIRVQLNCRGFL
jgi:hypothetical protein